MCPETAEAQAVALAERLRRAVAGVRIPIFDREITVSIGVVGAPASECDMRALVADVDRALYTANRGGRNCVVVSAAA